MVYGKISRVSSKALELVIYATFYSLTCMLDARMISTILRDSPLRIPFEVPVLDVTSRSFIYEHGANLQLSRQRLSVTPGSINLALT